MNGSTGQRLGIIVRADEGGLGTQTLEYARHLKPDVVLIVEVMHASPQQARGEFLPERFTDLGAAALLTQFPAPDPEAERVLWETFAMSCDVILTAETPYRLDFPAICTKAGTALVVHANPELWEWGMRPPFEVWMPTRWLNERIPSELHMPVPVDRSRCVPRTIEKVRDILHISSPAMQDRNGTDIVAQALAHCSSTFTLHVAGPGAPAETVQMGAGVTVRPIAQQRDYWRIYDGMDALLLPRRYGGLCLPMQEAASCGLPIIAPLVPPQLDHLALACGVPGRGGGLMMSKGGPIQMWTVDPVLLARSIDRLVAGDSLEDGRRASEEWAESLDWEGWAPLYDGGLKHAAAQKWGQAR